jgi:signal transduction histidine kinase
MPIDKELKDEIRELISTEMKNAVKAAVNAVVNMPTPLGEIDRFGMDNEARERREARQKIAREVGDAIIKSFEAVEREAQARVVEKTDPERANRIRRMVPTF